jgi:ribonuclease Y
MEFIYVAILVLFALAVGAGVGVWFYINRQKKIASPDAAELERLKKNFEQDVERIRQEARLQAQEELFQQRKELDQEIKAQRAELHGLEKRLLQKENQLDRKEEFIAQKEVEIRQKEKEISKLERRYEEKNREYDNLLSEQKRLLEQMSGMSHEEAKQYLLNKIETEVRQDAAILVKRIEQETKEIADKKAKEIISLAIARYAGDYVAEKTVSAVALPSEEMKGRIIGREGRNIRALEAITGVDLIIDDTPEAVLLSSFNPVRREVARIALERLIADGRIHPARIEEMVKKVEKEVDNAIREAGEQATFDVGVYGINPELIRILGKLKFRTSYAQNVLQHSIEVAFLCGVMASELGINVKKAKRAGLLHDIGKAVDHEVEGSHAIIGADLAKKYGEPPDVIHAIAAHHEDVKPETVLAVLVQAADALSGARPGARRETLESYVKRLEELEAVATSIPGVNKSYAIQAGREIRIMVDSGRVSDAETSLLCKEIAKKIETQLTYPGQIKVVVVRETRHVEYAK